MNRIKKSLVIILAVVMLLMSACALAEGVISTTVIMRVSRITQNAVVDVGEDLSMEVQIDGVEPAVYQWYYEGEAILGANQKVYSIIDAQVEDSGIYRMDAYDAEGKMLVSMDISARVIDNSVPKAGDASMPVGIAVAGLALSASVLAFVLRRKVKA